MNCPGCNTPIPQGKDRCPMCGATMEKIRHDSGLQQPEAIKAPAAEVKQSKISGPPQKKCPQCAMDVPKAAIVCPYCRKTIAMSLTKKIILGFFCLIFALPIITGILSGGSKPPAAPQVQPTAAEIAHNKEKEEHDEAQEHVKSFILKSLKAPSTAKFPGYSEIPVVKKDGYWESYTYVDAQNSYGAMIRTNYYVKMENQGDRWKLVKIDSGF